MENKQMVAKMREMGRIPPLNPDMKANPSAVNTYPKLGRAPITQNPHTQIGARAISDDAASRIRFQGGIRDGLRATVERIRRSNART